MTKQEVYELSNQHPIILFDGVCLLCNKAIQNIIERDHAKVFRFMALQKAQEQGIVDLSTAPDSIILLQNEKVLYQSDAILSIMGQLNKTYQILGRLARIFPRFIRDFAYSLIAKWRYRLFGQSDTCMIPPPGWKDRFVT